MKRFSTLLKTSLIPVVALVAQSTSADAYATFFNPKHAGYALDWCATYAKNCGQPVAYTFCRNRGYRGVLSFDIKHNIGIPNRKYTRMIWNGHFCNGYHCDGFRQITCTNN